MSKWGGGNDAVANHLADLARGFDAGLHRHLDSGNLTSKVR